MPTFARLEAALTLLIFDCDGVLVDSEILHAEIESAIGRDLLGLAYDPQAHARRFSGRGLQSVYSAWEEASGKPLPCDLDAEMSRRKAEAFSTRLQAMPHMAEVLAALAGIPCCVASGTPVPTLEIALRATGLLDYFAPHLFSSDMVERGKPAPDIFLYAATRMGASPDECIVIEDSAHGVQAALAAGMRVIGFVGGSHCDSTHADRLHGADPIIADIRALPAIVALHP